MFYKRLEKAIKQDLKSDKAHDLQCICEYLQYKLKNDVSFEKYQEIQLKEIREALSK